MALKLLYCLLAWALVITGCKRHAAKEKMFGKLRVAYTAEITTAQITAVGTYLARNLPFPDSATVQLDKTDGSFDLKIVIKKDEEINEKMEETLRWVGIMLSFDVLGGNRLTIQLCDENFETRKILPSAGAGKIRKAGDNYLFYTTAVAETMADALINYLVENNIAGKIIQLDSKGNAFEVKVVLKSGSELIPETIESCEILAETLSCEVFNNSPVHFSTGVLLPHLPSKQ